jgi:CRP-like cAMP-binding protein
MKRTCAQARPAHFGRPGKLKNLKLSEMELTLGHVAYAQATQCYIMMPEHNCASASGRECEPMGLQPYDKNSFLSALSPSEFGLLRSHLTSFDLRVGDRLHELGMSVEQVIFPHSGLVVMTMSLRDGPGAGVILIGRDGIVGGFAAAAWAPATCDAEVHIGGLASRMSTSAFRFVLDQSPAIRCLAARFDSAMMAQSQQTALCNAAHSVEARICRLLLEVHDRGDSSRVPLTQSSLAQTLGVRRTTVTLVAGRLEAAGALTCRRGYVQILSREELERRSCECYGHVKRYLTGLFATTSEDDSAAVRHKNSARDGRLIQESPRRSPVP